MNDIKPWERKARGLLFVIFKDVLDVFTLQCPRIGSNQGIDFFTNLTIQLFDDLPGYYIESWYV